MAQRDVPRLLHAAQHGLAPLVDLYLHSGDCVDEADDVGFTGLTAATCGHFCLGRAGGARRTETTTLPRNRWRRRFKVFPVPKNFHGATHQELSFFLRGPIPVCIRQLSRGDKDAARFWASLPASVTAATAYVWLHRNKRGQFCGILFMILRSNDSRVLEELRGAVERAGATISSVDQWTDLPTKLKEWRQFEERSGRKSLCEMHSLPDRSI